MDRVLVKHLLMSIYALLVDSVKFYRKWSFVFCGNMWCPCWLHNTRRK